MKDRIHGWFHKQERARWSLRWRITGNADTNFSLQCFQWCHSFCFCQGRRSWLVKDNKYMKDRFHRSACSSFHLYKQVWRVCQARPLPAQVRTCFHCFPSFCSLFSLMNAERRLTCRDQTHTIVTTYYHISQPSAQALLKLSSSHKKGICDGWSVYTFFVGFSVSNLQLICLTRQCTCHLEKKKAKHI